MSLSIKQSLHLHVEYLIQQRIQQAKLALDDTIYARDNESKSSAGDKYETGRAMMQIAQQQQEIQLNAAYTLLQQLKTIVVLKVDHKVNLGSLVETNHGIFYLSIGMGEVRYKDNSFYLISMAAPLAQLLKAKVKGEVFEFRNKTYKILKIN